MKKNAFINLALAIIASSFSFKARADTLTGDDKNNTLTGGIGLSSLQGGKGNDTLYGDPPLMKVSGPPSLELFVRGKGPKDQGEQPNLSSFIDNSNWPGYSNVPVFSSAPIFSKDGKKMVFTSEATNLVPGVVLAGSKVYAMDTETGAHTLVSAIEGKVGTGYEPSISSDGLKVVFASNNPALYTGSDKRQILVKNLSTGSLSVLSRNRINGNYGNGDSGDPVFSPDGTMVAFVSKASNLIFLDSKSSSDIYIAKYTGNKNDYKTLVLATPQLGYASYWYLGRESFDPIFSPDSKSIAFTSANADFSPETFDLNKKYERKDTNVLYDIFVKNIDPAEFTSQYPLPYTGVLKSDFQLVSAREWGTQPAECSNFSPAFSPQGNKIAFLSDCDTLVFNDSNSGGLFDVDLFVKTRGDNGVWRKGPLELISKDKANKQAVKSFISHFSFSPDGSKLAFASNGVSHDKSSFSSSGLYQIYVKDLVTQDLALLSRSPTGDSEGNNNSFAPHFLPNGTGIVFQSSASNLIPHDTNAVSDIFLVSPPVTSNSGTGDVLHGEDGNDRLFGFRGADRLYGHAGNDTLDGGLGADIMNGGLGDDVYIVDNTSDQVSEHYLGGGGLDSVYASISYTLPVMIEHLTLTDNAKINGIGNDLANVLKGNSADNALEGGGGNDILHGGLGADFMNGGLGDDIYYIDNTGDIVVESTFRGGGMDTVSTSVDHTLYPTIENLALDGAAAIKGTGNGLPNIITGNAGNNLLTGDGSSDSLFGFSGEDTLHGGDGDDKLYGGLGKDTLHGNAGHDTLDGGPGIDSMKGGIGDDIYYVDNLWDVVAELPEEGKDTIITKILGYPKPPDVETLIVQP